MGTGDDTAAPARVLLAAIVYFTMVFALGFALGVVRVLVLAPIVGDHSAVLIELPVMIGASWFASRWVTECAAVPAALGARLAMGGVAFSILLFAELGVSVLAFGRSAGEHLATYRSTSALLGLGGQIIFGLIPALQRKR